MDKYDHGLKCVAAVTPSSTVYIGKRCFHKSATQQVNRKIAEKAIKDKRFKVVWYKGESPEEIAAKKKEEAAEAKKTTEAKPAPKEVPKEQPKDYKPLLEEFNNLTVKETDGFLAEIDDKEAVAYLAKKATKKGSKANAKERLAELNEA